MNAIAKAGHRSSVRRFEGAAIDPASAIGLTPNHAALVEGRTIFPSTVVSTLGSPRFLVSGHNNPKLGKTVLKGPRAGWPIFHVTLEERATCPRSCHAWAECYGNAMPYARRHRVDAAFLENLKAEVLTTARAHPAGLLIRLHTLGDFYSVEYVMVWAELLARLPQLHVFGYTARREDADDPESRKIAKVIRLLTERAWERFAIRFSRDEAGPGRSIVVDADPGTADIIVCPAQTKQTEACASCGLCWADAARDKTIAFLRHGMKRGTGARAPASTAEPRKRQLPRPKAERVAAALAECRKATANLRTGAKLARRFKAALPELFKLFPRGVPASQFVSLGGEPYATVIKAIQQLDRSGDIRWVYSPIQRGGKVALPPHGPAPALDAGGAADLTPSEAALLTAMEAEAVDGVFSKGVTPACRSAGIPAGSGAYMVGQLVRKGRVVVEASGRFPTYRILRPLGAQRQIAQAAPKAAAAEITEEDGEDDVAWTDDMVEGLREHVSGGSSASQAGKSLGVSRNAAIGKARRLGLQFNSHDNGVVHRDQKREKAERRQAATKRNGMGQVGKPKPPSLHLLRATAPLAEAAGRPWTTRAWNECAWPVGGEGADLLSCCAPATPLRDGDAAYCLAHQREMFAPTKMSAAELRRSLRRYA